MAGHSKWSNTKHRKKSQDIKKSKIFMKIIREITNATIKNGPNLKKNSQLRSIIEKANYFNINKETIKRAIKRGTGNNNKKKIVPVRYAGYLPNGIAIIINCITDNSNRTVSEIRNIFTKFKGQLVNYSSIEYLFIIYQVLYIETQFNLKDILNNINSIDIKKITKNKKYKKLIIPVQNIKNIKLILSQNKINIKKTKIIIEPKIKQKIYKTNITEFKEFIYYLKKKIPEINQIFHNAVI